MSALPRRFLPAAAVLVLLLGLPRASMAQDAPEGEPEQLSAAEQEARQLFNAGRIAFNDGRFDDALAYFERSHELSGRPELLFNIGAAADRMRQNQRALEAFEAYLEARPDAPNRREVEGRIRVLRQTLVATPAEAAAGSDAAQPPPAEPLAPADDDGESGSVLGTWWFWTLVGVVVAGGVATAVILAQDDGADQDALILGDDGVVHFTLTEAP